MPSEGAGEYTTARFEPFFSPEPDLESEPGLAPQEPITPDATPPPSNGCLFAWQDKEEEQDHLFDKEKPERDRVWKAAFMAGTQSQEGVCYEVIRRNSRLESQ